MNEKDQEIIYVIKGEGICIENGKEYPVTEEDISACCDQDAHWKIKLTIQEKTLDKAE